MGIRLDFKRKGVATITWIDREPGATPVSDALVIQTPVAQMSPAELEGYKQGRIAEELVSQARDTAGHCLLLCGERRGPASFTQRMN